MGCDCRGVGACLRLAVWNLTGWDTLVMLDDAARPFGAVAVVEVALLLRFLKVDDLLEFRPQLGPTNQALKAAAGDNSTFETTHGQATP